VTKLFPHRLVFETKKLFSSNLLDEYLLEWVARTTRKSHRACDHHTVSKEETMPPFDPSFNVTLVQALADPMTILLISLASTSRRGIICEVVSPHGFSMNVNVDGDITACPLDVSQGLFSSSLVCKDRAMVSVHVEEVYLDIGPVTNRERIVYTAASPSRVEARVHLANGKTHIEACRSYADVFQINFEAPCTAFVQLCRM
jgi:hypothetical protein